MNKKTLLLVGLSYLINNSNIFAQSTEAEIKQQIINSNVLNELNKESAKAKNNQEAITTINYDSTVVEVKAKNEIFGSELYLNQRLNFLPQRNIPNPEEYVLGMGDELNINIFGVQEFFTKQVVDNNGKIHIDHYGPINVNGLTIKQAENKIKLLLSKTIYKYLQTGGSNLLVTLDKIKTINVTLVGAQKSGNYNISSLSTIFHILYLGGGPDVVNSYRIVQLYRNSRLFKTIDMYEFLITGDKKNNINLQNGDVVIIPPFQNRVYVNGEVKRKGYFEVKDNGESLKDVLKYTGGFNYKLSSKNIQITRVVNEEKRIFNIDTAEMLTYQLKNGDEINFKSINESIKNQVFITGSVLHPGVYQNKIDFSINELINTAGGFIAGAYLKKGTIWRLNENLIKYPITVDFNSKEIDAKLSNNDSLVIYSYSEFNELKYVTIKGEIRKPGIYQFKDELNLSDLLILSGGISDRGNKAEVEIIRKKKTINKFNKEQSYNEIFRIQVDSNFNYKKNDFQLEYEDIVNVKLNPNLFTNKTVYLNGEVLYPGVYTLLNSEERISSLVKRAGSITVFGNVEGAKIYRKSSLELIQNSVSEQLKLFQKYYKVDTNEIDKEFIVKEIQKTKPVIINLSDAIKNNNGINDLILEDGDSVYIPTTVNTITVEGEVFNKGIFIFNPGKGLKYYLNLASGLTKNADKDRVFLIRANGAGSRTKKALWLFRRFPAVSQGATVYIPPKFEQNTSYLNNLYNKGIANPINNITNRLTNLTDTFLSFYLLKGL